MRDHNAVTSHAHSYAPALPAFLFVGVRSKLFANAPGGISASPFHHPTPNLQRLDDAAVESRMAAEAAAVPASPTLAKLMGRSSQSNLSAAPALGAKRTFQRSKSLASNAANFRRPLEVDMVPKRHKASSSAVSIDPAQSSQSQKPAPRAHRRKQASPKRALVSPL